MKKIMISIEYLIILLSLTVYMITIFNPYLGINYLDSFIYFIILTILVYTFGLFINEDKHYKINIRIYFILYFVMLMSLTMFIRRPNISLNQINISEYFNSLNLIPFKTIGSYINNCLTDKISFYNIFGNLIALMPLSFLLMLKDEKNINILKQITKLSLMVLIIEVIQFVFNCGIFDIDDFILNLSGSLLFYIIIAKTKLIYKIRKFFYTDFKLSNKIKLPLLIIFILIETVIQTDMIYHIIEVLNYHDEIKYFYVTTNKDECHEKKFKIDDYNLYLECVDVGYRNDETIMNISSALKYHHISRNDLLDKLILIEENEKGKFYISEDDVMHAIVCRNNDIYLGNHAFNFEDIECK